MSKRQIIMLLGVWVMILFVLGLPGYIKEILALATGLSIVLVASRMGSDVPSKPASSMPYVESKRPPIETPKQAPPVVEATPPVTRLEDITRPEPPQTP